jgi:hypothetical protein
LEDELGDQLPKKYWSRRRPKASSRLFPYRNEGKQQNSIKVGVSEKVSGDNISLSAWGQIDVPYAYYTNLGLKQRRPRRNSNETWADIEEVGWKGWVDDVFEGAGRGNVTSISTIFDILVEKRRRL